jgi:cytoskeleton protein RodZ
MPPRSTDELVAGAGAEHPEHAECVDDRPQPDGEMSAEPPGLMLRRAREARHLSLEHVARATKIPKSTLAAIEASDVLHLPAAIYTRGFVKAYAQEVGLDPDETATAYLRGLEPLTTQHLLVEDGMLPPLAPGAHREVDPNEDAKALLATNQLRRFGWLTMAGAAIGLIVYVASVGREAQRAAIPLPPPTQSAASDAAPAVEGSSSAEGQRGDVVPAAARAQITLELIPQRECWVSAIVDGERVVARLLQRGERQTLAINEEAQVRIGDPAAMEISINGHSGRSLGLPGQPVTIRITRDNFREFLSS